MPLAMAEGPLTSHHLRCHGTRQTSEPFVYEKNLSVETVKTDPTNRMRMRTRTFSIL